MNGCICCTVCGDLVKVLKKLYERIVSFTGVIIETTGLADPAPVIQTFFLDDEISAKYTLDSVITVTDAFLSLYQLCRVRKQDSRYPLQLGKTWFNT